MLRAFVLSAGLSAYLGQQIDTIGAKIIVQKFMHVRIVGIADWVAAVRGHLAETVKIQLSNEARDVARLEDGPARVQVLCLKSLVIEQYGIAIRAPSDRPGLAFVHYSPELLRKSHWLQHTMFFEHSCRSCWMGNAESRIENVSNVAFRPMSSNLALLETKLPSKQKTVTYHGNNNRDDLRKIAGSESIPISHPNLQYFF